MHVKAPLTKWKVQNEDKVSDLLGDFSKSV